MLIELLTSCITKVINGDFKFQNICEERFPDLLTPIEKREVKTITLKTEAEREVCLQEWVKEYLKKH